MLTSTSLSFVSRITGRVRELDDSPLAYDVLAGIAGMGNGLRCVHDHTVGVRARAHGGESPGRVCVRGAVRPTRLCYCVPFFCILYIHRRRQFHVQSKDYFVAKWGGYRIRAKVGDRFGTGRTHRHNGHDGYCRRERHRHHTARSLHRCHRS